MAEKLGGNEPHQNIIEKAVGRMMGGSTAKGDQTPEIVIGTEYGRTPYSEEPLKMYERRRDKRTTLDAGEYHAVTNGYLREWVCMGQCNLYMQAKNAHRSKTVKVLSRTLSALLHRTRHFPALAKYW